MNERAGRARTRRSRDERIGEILGAARDAFGKRGYEQTSVAEIAQRVGIVEGTVFRYFPTKRDLWMTVLAQWYEQLLAECERALPGITGTRARLRFLVWRHLETIRRDRPLCRLMFSEFRSGEDYRGSRLHELNRRYTQFMVDVLRDAAAAGEFRSDVPATLLRDLVYGGIEHQTWNYVCGRGTLNPERLADRITALVCEGVLRSADAGGLEQHTQRLGELVQRIENAVPPAGEHR